jgi:hypothetical protein
MNAYVCGSVTASCMLKHCCMLAVIFVIVTSVLSLMFVFHSLTSWLNSVATIVGSRSLIMSSPVYVSVWSKLWTCLLISCSRFRFLDADLRSVDSVCALYHCCL